MTGVVSQFPSDAKEVKSELILRVTCEWTKRVPQEDVDP